MPAERPKLLTLSSLCSAGIRRAPPSPCNSVMEAHLWLIQSGTVEERRSQPGVQERGQSPAVFFSLPFSLLCKCISNAYDLWVFFSHAMISLFLIPSYSPAHSFYLLPSIFVSVTLAFPTARPAFISVPLPP